MKAANYPKIQELMATREQSVAVQKKLTSIKPDAIVFKRGAEAVELTQAELGSTFVDHLHALLVKNMQDSIVKIDNELREL